MQQNVMQRGQALHAVVPGCTRFNAWVHAEGGSIDNLVGFHLASFQLPDNVP
jgi:hypothetical protein